MIDCKECVEYAHMVLARGEITVEDVSKLALDRHILKGCGKEAASSPFDMDEMSLNQLKDVMKMMHRLMNHEHDRLTALQERVLSLESQLLS